MVSGDTVTGLEAAEHAVADAWTWGAHTLIRVHSIRYLGVQLHESGSWVTHVQQATQTGLQVLHQWARVLASSWLPVRLKMRLTSCPLRPVMKYGMKVWGPSNPHGAVVVRLWRCASKLCRSAL